MNIRPRPARSEKVLPLHLWEAAAWENQAMRNATGGEVQGGPGLGGPAIILSRMEPGREYTTTDIVNRTGYHPKTAVNHLCALAREGLVTRVVVKIDRSNVRMWRKV